MTLGDATFDVHRLSIRNMPRLRLAAARLRAWLLRWQHSTEVCVDDPGEVVLTAKNVSWRWLPRSVSW
jgi:hypothetical protein